MFLFPSRSSVAKHLESANTMFSFIWWIIGFYWVSTGGQALALASPQLYWFVRSLFVSLSWSFNLKSSWSSFVQFAVQALCGFPWIRRVLCRFLRCSSVHHRDCCLLLPSLYYCTSICRRWPGKISWLTNSLVKIQHETKITSVSYHLSFNVCSQTAYQNSAHQIHLCIG